jgi:hypothetical protein
MLRYKLMTICLLAIATPVVFADEETTVTPYRPTVCNPAQLSTPGQLELEFGGLRSKAGGSYRDSLPYLLKLGFNENWGILLGGEAYVQQPDDSGQRQRGFGDTNLVLKRAFILDEAAALGVEAGVKLPTARDAIGSGHSDYSLNGIYSRDMGKIHMDVNMTAVWLGAHEPGSSRVQSGLAASFSGNLSDKWGTALEWSGTRRSGVDSTSQLLAAITYSPSKSMTLDAGFIRGLNKATPDWSLFTGIVIPVAKLW